MPINTDAIAPSEEVTGTVSLPLARVKKTIASDEDLGPVSAQATFVIAKATELFVQYAAGKAWDIAKTETKPKKSLTYTHLANAVARTDNLEFLSDIVPQTTTLRAHRARKAQEAATAAESASRKARAQLDPKQTTLSGAGPSFKTDPMDLTAEGSTILRSDGDEAPSAEAVAVANGTLGTNLVFQHYAPNGNAETPNQDDVEMS